MSCKSWRLNLTNWEIAGLTLTKAIRAIQLNVSWTRQKNTCWWYFLFCRVQAAFSVAHKAHIYDVLGRRYDIVKMMAPIHPANVFYLFLFVLSPLETLRPWFVLSISIFDHIGNILPSSTEEMSLTFDINGIVYASLSPRLLEF